jgi:hypothetical protein
MLRKLSVAALVTLLAALPVAATAKAPAAKAQSSGADFDLKDLSVAGYIGGEFGDVTTFALRADASLPLMPLTPQIKLHGVASLGFDHGGLDVPFGTTTWNIVTLIPAARFQLRVAPKLDLYGDVGLGLYFGSESTETTLPILGTVKTSSSNVGVLMRFAAGGFYEINPKLKLAGELGLTPYFSKVSSTNFVALIGAQFKI